MKALFCIVAALMLTGCSPEPGAPASQWKYIIDKDTQAKRFDACMQALPAGPVSTHYNDWAEVVDSCRAAAIEQAKRLAKSDNQGVWHYQDGTPVK